MYLCFVFSENGKKLSAGSATRILGNRYVLDVLRSPDEGPWYPHIAENLDSETYQFFAGRLAGVHPSDKLPQGHAICDPKAENWKFASEEPDGSWIGLKFDRRRDVVSIANDLFLLQRWYYTCQDGNWYFTNSLLFLYRVLQGKLDIEQRAVPYMLLWGYLPFQFTPLKDVYDLRPGRVLTIDKGESRLTVRAEIPIHRRKPIPSEDAPQMILSVLRDAVERELQNLDSVLLPLSGGIDSRFLLGIALDILPHEQITTLTFGHPRSFDFTIGTRLSKKLGVTNIALPMDKRPIGEILDQNFRNAEGMYWVYPDYPVEPYANALIGKKYNLSGYIGDVVFGSYDIPESALSSESHKEEEQLLALIRQKACITPPTVISSLLNLETWDVFEFEKSILDSPGSGIREKYHYWIYGNHQIKRTNFSIELHRDKVFYLAPYVHRNLLDIAYALPAAERLHEKAFFAALKEALPELYAFPSKNNYGFPLGMSKNLRIFTARAWRRMRMDFDKYLGTRIGKIIYHHPRNNYAHPRELQKSIHRQDVLECLEELTNLDIFDRGRLAVLRHEYSHKRALNDQLLRGLLTVHRWMKFYRE